MLNVIRIIEDLCKKYKIDQFPLVDIQISHCKQSIIMNNKLGIAEHKLQKMIIKLKSNLNLSSESPRHESFDVQKFQNLLSAAILFATPKGKKQIRAQFKLLQQYKKLHQNYQELKNKIEQLKDKRSEIKAVFITFSTVRMREFFLKALPYTWRHKLTKMLGCRLCRCRRGKGGPGGKGGGEKGETMTEKSIYAKEPPEPVNILWKNYSYSWRQKKLRRAVSWVFYLLLYLIRKKKLEF